MRERFGITFGRGRFRGRMGSNQFRGRIRCGKVVVLRLANRAREGCPAWVPATGRDLRRLRRLLMNDDLS